MTPKTLAGFAKDTPEGEFQYAHYSECCDRIDVNVYHTSAVSPIGDQAEMTANWIVDTVSGSSPVLNVPASRVSVISGASRGRPKVVTSNDQQPVSASDKPVQVMSAATIRDTRYAGDLGGTYYLNDTTLNISGGTSTERDYDSYFINWTTLRDFNQKMTTAAFGFGLTYDVVEPNDRDIEKDLFAVNSLVGVTRILDKNSLFQSNLTYTYSTGFLANPYKKVFIEAGDPRLDKTADPNVFFENRPNQRHQVALMGRYRRFFQSVDGALHIGYRFHTDSWGIDSHTFEVTWHQPLGSGWRLAPRFRYYSQDKADFYGPFFVDRRSDGDYSSDYRLSGYGALSGGVTLTREFLDRVQLQVGFEYYQHKADLKLGNQTQAGFADFEYTLITAGIKIKF